MSQKFVLVAISLMAVALPLPGQANTPPPEICDIVWQPRMKSDGEKNPPDDDDKGCPKEGAERPWTPFIADPCVPDPLTGLCKIDE